LHIPMSRAMAMKAMRWAIPPLWLTREMLPLLRRENSGVKEAFREKGRLTMPNVFGTDHGDVRFVNDPRKISS
jgi:hypothetical protein